MVNFVIDNLLSSAKNRAIYETLWSLVIHKKKVEQQKYQNVCLTQICNYLLEDINNNLQYSLEQKNRFYFATQLTFGAIQVYKLQINKLFNEVKHALAACTSKAFELDWLNSSQSVSERSVNTSVKTNHKKRKITERDVLLECLALETFDEDVFKIPKPAKKIPKIQSIDPTTVHCSKTITLFDQFYPTQSTTECNDDDFGALTAEEFQVLHSSQQSDLLTNCVKTKSKKRKYSECSGLSEHSQNSDRTTIWEPTTYNEVDHSDVFDDDVPRCSTQTKRSKRCDSLQDFSLIEDQNLHDMSSFDNSANDLNNINDHTFIYNQETNPTVLEETEILLDLNCIPPSLNMKELMLPKIDQLQPKRNQKQRKFRFVDKLLKMPVKKNLSASFDQYQKHHMEDSPRENFDQMIYKNKFGVNVLFQIPSRPNISPHLMKQLKRNLKKIPQSVINKKSPRVDLIQELTPTINSTRKMNSAAVKCSDKINNNTISEIELPDLENDMLKSVRVALWMEDEIDVPEPVAVMKPKPRYSVVDEYDEDKRWSQDMIMERLEELWNTGVEQINMKILCGRLNRFVCAGIFFELMNLSKIGMITLESTDGCPEISHIQRNES